ncbi:hypothetical protein [Thioalkalivibrio sp. HK1]|nr:hypothetical protein [Thioalkalivibrio sp. HK1]
MSLPTRDINDLSAQSASVPKVPAAPELTAPPPPESALLLN